MITKERIEEIKTYHTNQDCDECIPEEACIKEFTQEEREAYAAVYGCICGVRCNHCKDWEECFVEEDQRNDYLASIPSLFK